MFKICMTAGAALLIAGPAFAGPVEEHFDVWLRINNDGELVTGSISEDEVPLSPNARVFGAEFGEEPTEPFGADEPGFQLINGSLTPGTILDWQYDDAISVWNGNGFDATTAQISMSFGPATATSGAGAAPGFGLAVDNLGGFHDHFEIEIFDNVAPGDPAVGVYLVPLSFSGPGALGSTDTFWFVMNLGADEADHDAAIDWVQDNLAPTPGALALLAIAGLRRRRRRD